MSDPIYQPTPLSHSITNDHISYSCKLEVGCRYKWREETFWLLAIEDYISHTVLLVEEVQGSDMIRRIPWTGRSYEYTKQ